MNRLWGGPAAEPTLLERRARSLVQTGSSPALAAGTYRLAVVGLSPAGVARTYRLVHRPGRSDGLVAAIRRLLTPDRQALAA